MPKGWLTGQPLPQLNFSAVGAAVCKEAWEGVRALLQGASKAKLRVLGCGPTSGRSSRSPSARGARGARGATPQTSSLVRAAPALGVVRCSHPTNTPTDAPSVPDAPRPSPAGVPPPPSRSEPRPGSELCLYACASRSSTVVPGSGARRPPFSAPAGHLWGVSCPMDSTYACSPSSLPLPMLSSHNRTCSLPCKRGHCLN